MEREICSTFDYTILLHPILSFRLVLAVHPRFQAGLACFVQIKMVCRMATPKEGRKRGIWMLKTEISVIFE